MKNYRFKTSKACEVARVDRNQLNEMIASGRYRRAPLTSKGSTRIFSLEEMITLFIFGQMIRFGIPAPRAADYASEIDINCGGSYARNPVIGIVAAAGLGDRGSIMVLNENRALPRQVYNDFTGGALVFDIEGIRNHIVRMAEYEIDNPIIGDDDD